MGSTGQKAAVRTGRGGAGGAGQAGRGGVGKQAEGRRWDAMGITSAEGAGQGRAGGS
jgi:hypothetical protein